MLDLSVKLAALEPTGTITNGKASMPVNAQLLRCAGGCTDHEPSPHTYVPYSGFKPQPQQFAEHYLLFDNDEACVIPAEPATLKPGRFFQRLQVRALSMSHSVPLAAMELMPEFIGDAQLCDGDRFMFHSLVYYVRMPIQVELDANVIDAGVY